MNKLENIRKVKVQKIEFNFEDNRVTLKITESRRRKLCVSSYFTIHQMRLSPRAQYFKLLTENWQSERVAKFKDFKNCLCKYTKKFGMVKSSGQIKKWNI